MAARATEGFITVTELADTLTRDHGAPFKASHTVACRFVAACNDAAGRSRADVLREVSKDVLGYAVPIDEPALDRLLSPRHFVEVRKTLGGPSPSVTADAIAASRRAHDEDCGWLTGTIERLRAAEGKLKEAASRLA
jgi:argininosuccinate lyase